VPRTPSAQMVPTTTRVSSTTITAAFPHLPAVQDSSRPIAAPRRNHLHCLQTHVGAGGPRRGQPADAIGPAPRSRAMSQVETPTPQVGGSILGHPVKRTEDVRLITGAGLYADDVALTADGLHAGFVRSPLAHARIRSIDASAA